MRYWVDSFNPEENRNSFAKHVKKLKLEGGGGGNIEDIYLIPYPLNNGECF